MIQRGSLAACALLAAAALAGCSGGMPEEVANLSYINRDYRFAMDVPPAWTVRESTGLAVVYVTAPAAEGQAPANVNVVADSEHAATTLDELVRENRARLEKLPGFKLVSEGPVKTADGGQAWTLVFRQSAFEKPLMQKQLLRLAGGRAYILTATAAPEAFAAEEPNFEICFRSFRAGW